MKAKSSNSILMMDSVAVVAMALGVYFSKSDTASNQTSPVSVEGLKKAVIFPYARTFKDVQFTSHKSTQFTQRDFQGYWNIVFFGFTNCPDICPTTMHTLKQVKRALTEQNQWGNYRVIMVSVDPERDTVERLANYVPFYDPEFVGLTAPLEVTTEFAKDLGILFVAHEADENGRYDVDHSTALILINPNAEFAGLISAPHKSTEIVADLATLAGYFEADHAQQVEQSNTMVANEKAAITTHSKPTQKTDIVIENAWVRAAAPGSDSMAAYLTLINKSKNNITIQSVESPQFDEAMIHETVSVGDIAEMKHLDSLKLGSAETINLQPLGKHIMLIDPVQELPLDSTVELIFTLANGESIRTLAPVQNPN